MTITITPASLQDRVLGLKAEEAPEVSHATVLDKALEDAEVSWLSSYKVAD